jgi:lysophospholipase L1-like esterase
MQGFQPWAFPNIPSQHIAINGFYGYTCAQLLPLVSSEVPAGTNAVFIMAATNDVAQHVTVAQHMACMESMINELIAENPHMLIELSNLPPFCQSTLPVLGDLRSAIASYNSAYTTFPQLYPNNVVMVDMWTPMVQTDGWGLSNMFMSDGAHFGPNGQDVVMGVIRDGLYAGLAAPR